MKKILLYLLLTSYCNLFSQTISNDIERKLKREYEEVKTWEIRFGYVPVKKDGKWGYANINDGVLEVSTVFEEVQAMSKDLVYAGKKKQIDGSSYWFLMNLKTGWSVEVNGIASVAFDDIKASFNGYRAAKSEGKYGFLSEDGRILIDFKFDEVSGVFDNFGINNGVNVKFNGKWRKINQKGDFID